MNRILVTITLALFTGLFTVTSGNAADRYAVNASSAAWNLTSTWSATSGGASGASVPVAGDNVFIGDAATARAVTIPSGYTAACANLTIGPASNSSLTLSAVSSLLNVSGDLTINRPGGNAVNALNVNAGTVTVSGDVTLAGTATQGNRDARVIITSGSLTIAGDLIMITGNVASNILDMSGGAGTLNLAGAFTFSDGTLTSSATSTVNFNGSAAGQTIPVGVSSVVYNNLNANNMHSSGATLSAAVTSSNVTGNLGVQTGTLNNGGFAITLASTKNFSVSSGATYNLTGTSTMVSVSGGGTKTFGSTSTVNYGGTAQTVSAETYGNLTLSGSGIKTMPGSTTTVAGNFTTSGTVTATAGAAINTSGIVTLGSGTTFSAGSFTHAVGGNWINNGATFNANSSTVNFNGSSAQTIGGSSSSTFNNAAMGNSTGVSLLLNQTINGTLTLSSGTLSVGSNVLSLNGPTIAGTPANLSTTAASSLSFGGSSAGVNIPSSVLSLNNLTIENANGVTLNSSLTISGTLTLTSGTLTVGAHTLTLNGPAITGTPSNLSTTSASSLSFGGSASSIAVPSSVTMLNNLTLNNSNGLTLNSDITLSGVLTLTTGNIATGANTLSMGGAGAVSRTSGHVIGNLKKTYTASANKDFEVGTANGYSPVAVNATGSGDFTVKAVQGAHPNTIGSNALSRYWTLTNSGLTSADLTFQYLAGDVTGTEANYFLARYNGSGSSWAVQGGSINTGAHTATTTGATSFSDWTAGESSSLLSVSIDDTTVTEGNSGTVNAGFTVSLSGTSTDPVAVDYQTSDGSATAADGDYTVSTTTLTFNPGESSKQVSAMVNGDTNFESNESFTVDLSNPSGLTITDAQGVGTITNDDSQPTISVDDVTMAEGNAASTNFGFTVSLSNPSSQTVTVDYASSNNTATTADGDYTGVSTTTLTFNPGETTKAVDVSVTGDTKFESNETFNVDLSNPSNAAIADAQGVGTITNDDASPTLSIDDVTANEGNSGSSTFGFTVSLSAVCEVPVTVDYATFNGTATTADGDYTGISITTLTFNPGETSKPVNVTVHGDTKFELNETFNVDLSNPFNATIADAQGVGTITNDDGQPTVTVHDAVVTEGNSGTVTLDFTVDLSNASYQTITFDDSTSDGSATLADSDYDFQSGTITFNPGETSKLVSVVINGDTKFEADEIFSLEGYNLANATFADASGTGTITNDDAAPTLSIDDVTANENNSGSANFGFTVSLSNPSSQTVTVDYATSNNTATTADGDYTGISTATLTFNPGETSKSVNVSVNGDPKFEANEAFNVDLSNPSNAAIADAQGVGTINNDDSQPTVTLQDASVTEGNSGTVSLDFTVILSNASYQTITFEDSTIDGSATLADNDYDFESGVVTFNPGETSKTVSITVNSDTKYELDETLTLAAYNLSNATFADDEAAGTITNDDGQPTVTVQDANVFEGNAGTVMLDFTVQLSNASYQTITFEDSTNDGTATLGDNDYELQSGTVTFNPGETSKTVSVVVNGDNTYELNEALSLEAFNLVNATFADAVGAGSILNDDALPSISINDVTQVEGNSGSSSFGFTVSLSNPSSQTITVDYATSNGTATTADNDYTAVSTTTLTFNPGETSKSVSVSVNGDVTFEPNENFNVDLSNVSNATIADAQGIGTITSDDAGSMVSINDVTAIEGNSGTTSFGFTLSLSNPSGQTITVDYTASNGSATAADADYVAVSATTVTFSPGETSKPVSIFVNGDTKFETNENFQVDLSNVVNAVISDSLGIGTITNDDSQPAVSVSDANVTEGNTGTVILSFNVDLSNASYQTVTFEDSTIDGSATLADNDYVFQSGSVTFNPGETSKTVSVTVQGDTKFEPNETMTLEGFNPVNATFADASGTGTFTNDDGVPTMSIDDVSANEGNSGSTSFGFTVGLSNPSSQTITVDYATSNGSATVADNDYTAISTTTLTFNPGETSKPVNVSVTGDVTNEGNETFNVDLSNPSNAVLSDAQGIGTITNDDGVPTVSISDVTANEGNSGSTSFGFTVSLSAASGQTITVDYATSNGSATVADNDYTAISTTTLTFNPGETSKPVNVSVTGDVTNEANETFNVDLSNPSNAALSDSQGVGTITNDDGAPSLSISDATASEGNSGSTTFGFTVSLSAASGQTVTVDYATSNGSATVADNDYTAVSTTTLTFNPGETSKPVSVSVTGDVTNEANETFNVDLSNPSNAALSDAQGIGTITNDDAVPAISINDFSANEGNSGSTSFGFTVSLSAVSGQAITVSYATSNGTATLADADYTAVSSTILTFNPGETSKPVNVSVAGDSKNEVNETFNVDLSNPSNAMLSDAQGVGTITNDDAVPSVSINDVTANEGNSGTTSFDFTASLSAASGQTVTVDYVTSDASATTAYNDYVAVTITTLIFNPGETSKPVNIPVNGDLVFEPTETFTVDLSNASNATLADAQGVGTITNDDAYSVSISLNDRWNIVSVPVTVSDYSKTALFPTATTDAIGYVGGSYASLATLENSLGYWVKFSGTQGMLFSGTERTADTVDVETGWNLIGSISASVPVANIGSIPGGIVTSVFYGYNTSYYSSASIEPGKGYWVNVSQAGQLVLNSTLVLSASNRIRIVDQGENPPPAPDGSVSNETGIPQEYSLSQNYPNPFNPSTKILYTLPADENVTLKVYNMMGQEVAVLVNEFQEAGYKVISFEASGMPSGMYFYKLTAGSFTDMKKMVLVK